LSERIILFKTLTKTTRFEGIALNNGYKYFAVYAIASIPLNFVTKDLLYVASPFSLTAIRFATMAAFLLVLYKKRPKIGVFEATMGLFIYISTILWLLSLTLLTPGDSIVISYSMPVIASLLGKILLKERANLWGAIISMSGFILYSIPLSSGSTLRGSLISFLNAFFWAAYSVLYRTRKETDVIEENASIFSAVATISVPLAIIDPTVKTGILEPRRVFDLFWFSVIGGVFQFLSWNKLIVYEGVEVATVSSYLVPISVLLIQSIYQHIPLELLQILGLSVAISGVFLSVMRTNKKFL